MNTKSVKNALESEYAMLAGFELLNAIPKTVWAAMVVSFIVNHEATEETSAVRARILHEWELLHQQGLVAQKPTAAARRIGSSK